jgi:acyl-CoA synthetase (AMP-forming)/AMP-acid ligase II
LTETASRAPERAAVIAPRGRDGWRTIAYGELDALSAAIAHGLAERGLARGDRVALLVRPGIDLIAIVFALFRMGAVPVLIDPGMGASTLVRRLARTRPRALLAVPLAHVARLWFARELESIEIAVQVGARIVPGIPSLDEIALSARGAFACAPVRADDVAAILFTSGSTGPAKGVVYTHGMFAAQIDALRALYRFRPGEVDLACFPLFALFDAALGTTCVIPRLDPSRPGACDPAAIAAALERHACTYSFGSPAIWRRLAPWAIERGVRFPALERVMIAGAPVSPALVAAMRTRIGVHGDVHTPYGATESLPVSSIASAAIEELRARIEGGFGSCVGSIVPGVDVALIAVADRAHARWSDVEKLPPRSIGEVCVRGALVTREYAEDRDATLRAKIRDEDGSVWHRMGDAGWIDDDGRLWIVGRVSDRIETRAGVVWPVPVENACDVHPRVRRTALVGLGARGHEVPTLVVEPARNERPRGAIEERRFHAEIEALRRATAVAGSPVEPARIERVLFERALPVDVRHNAKIRRDLLKQRAEASE